MKLSRLSVGIVVVAILLPVLVGATGVLLTLSWLPELPDPAAIHWGVSGTVDGTAPAAVFPIMLAALTVALPALFAGAVVLSAGREGTSRQQKILAGASLWTMVLLAGGFSWSAWSQRGLADATSAPNPAVPFLVIGAAGLAVSALALALLPKSTYVAPEAGEQPQPLQLAPGSRSVWVRRTSSPAGFVVLMAGVALLLAGVTALAIVVAGAGLWVIAFAPVLIVLLLVATTQFTVRVDASGLSVRSIVAIPRFHVPLAHITSASVVDVTPLGDFGGWGLRWGQGKRFGVIVRAGEAIEAHRADGRSFVVTVDDARTGAALLNALANDRHAIR